MATENIYTMKNTDELILNGFQLREWKKMIIQDFKDSEYQQTKWRKGRREGFLIAIKKLRKALQDYDVEACCHGVQVDSLFRLIDGIEQEGDKRFKIDRKKLGEIRKCRNEKPPIPYRIIALRTGLSEFTCMYWANPEIRKKHRWNTRKRRFGKQKKFAFEVNQE